ncbi:Fe-only hydrogenase, catalytic subunit HfsD [Chitinispirillum alkaliphilum]|nr:Fe-only hydrogenase, catalytic subunit HfsD [Chitinispirillum alkaliphilum]
MQYNNNSTRTRRNLLVRIARLFMEDKLVERADRIPLEMRPKGGSSYRCCIYKDRALIRYRVMAALGFGIEDETDELESLGSYSLKSIKRDAPNTGEPLLLLDEACSACVQNKYFVTNACRGCMARPCILNCPKKAITMGDKGQALIDSSKCVNCGICLKACPYHAIIRVPIPCEEACPAGAIEKDGVGKAQIDFGKCIYCGKCMQQCPFGAIMERSQIIDVLGVIKAKKNVVAMIAPASAAQFVAEYGQVVSALKKLGFSSVVEVAHGAKKTAIHEAEELNECIDEGNGFLTSSCCPSYVQAVQKHFPQLKERVSKTPSPMHYTAEMIKEKHPESKVVFIGPCVAKRKEAENDPIVDYVITSEEIACLFAAAAIDVAQLETDQLFDSAECAGRKFPLSGAVTEAVASELKDSSDLKGELLDGFNRQNFKLLKMYSIRGIKGNFLEVMACEGGCINGPCTPENSSSGRKRVLRLSQESQPSQPTEKSETVSK